MKFKNISYLFSIMLLLSVLFLQWGPTPQRLPASSEFKIQVLATSQSPDASKAMSIYQAQEQIIEAIENPSLSASKFQKEIESSQQPLRELEEFSQSVSQHFSQAAVLETPTDGLLKFDDIDKKLEAKLDHMQNYDFAILNNQRIRISVAQEKELPVDEMQQLFLPQRRLSNARALTKGEAGVIALGEMTFYKKNNKYYLFVSPENPIDETLLKQYFSDLGLNPTNISVLQYDSNWGKVVYQNFPEEAGFNKIKKEHMQGYIEEQFKKWKKSLDLDHIEQLLDDMIDGHKLTTESKAFAFLKDQRKKAAILRNAYYSYTKKGKSPKDFDQYVKTFGKLNDAIQSQNKDQIKSMAKKFKRYLIEDSKVSSMKLEVDIISGSALQKRMTELTREIAHALELNELSVKEFHEMRKQLKLLLLLVQDLGKHQGDQQLTAMMADELDHIVTRLGDWHDTHLTRELQGYPVLESFSIEAMDRKYIGETLERSSQIIMPKNCHEILKNLSQAAL